MSSPSYFGGPIAHKRTVFYQSANGILTPSHNRDYITYNSSNNDHYDSNNNNGRISLRIVRREEKEKIDDPLLPQLMQAYQFKKKETKKEQEEVKEKEEKEEKEDTMTLALQTVCTPTITNDDLPGCAIIKVTHVSICRTDVSQYQGLLGEDVVGKTPGHEVRGVVVSVKNPCPVSIGDHIVYFGGTDFGGLAEYKKINQCVVCDSEGVEVFWTDRFFYDTYGAAVVKLEDKDFLETASILEPLTCLLRAFYSFPPQPGQTGVVIGVGPIGLMVVQVMKRVYGLKRVIALDVQRCRLERAKSVGADEVFDISTREDCERIKSYVNEHYGKVADYAFEALPPKSEYPDARYYGALLLSPSAHYILFSADGVRESTEFWWLVLAKNITICSAGFDVGVFPMQKSAAVLKQALQIAKTGLVDVNTVVSQKVEFKDVEGVLRVFEEYGKGDVYKTVITLS